MDIVVRDTKNRYVELDKHYKVNDIKHPLHGKTVKLIDFADGARGQFFIGQKYDGTKVTLREEQIAPLDSKLITVDEWPGPEVKAAAEKLQKTVSEKLQGEQEDLLDACGSSSKEDRDNLQAAHNNRVHSYRSESNRAVKQLEIGQKLSDIMDKHKRQKAELEAWNDGTWFEKYYQPCPKKIGLTAGLQVANLTQLISLCIAGGAFPLLGLAVFCATLYGNYRILKTWHDNEE